MRRAIHICIQQRRKLFLASGRSEKPGSVGTDWTTTDIEILPYLIVAVLASYTPQKRAKCSVQKVNVLCLC